MRCMAFKQRTKAAGSFIALIWVQICAFVHKSQWGVWRHRHRIVVALLGGVDEFPHDIALRSGLATEFCNSVANEESAHWIKED
jgi:hypothetical protein